MLYSPAYPHVVSLTIRTVFRKHAGMARKLRLEYPGAIYHVMNRGDRREPIFKDHLDR